MKIHIQFLLLIISAIFLSCSKATILSDKTDSFNYNLTKEESLASYDYDYTGAFNDGLTLAIQDQKKYIINDFGEKQFNWVYDNKALFRNGTAIAEKNKHFGLVDKKGKIIVPLTFDYVDNKIFEIEAVYAINKNVPGIYFIKDKKFYPTNRTVDNALSKNKIVVSNIGHKGLSDLQGNLYHLMEQPNISIRSSHYTHSKNDKVGVLNNKGKVIIPYQYDELILLKDSEYISVSEADKDSRRKSYNFGIINMNNKTIIPMEYDAIHLQDEYFHVVKDGLHGLLNTNNQEIIPVKYNRIIFRNHRWGQDNYPVLSLNGKKGIIKITGEKLTQIAYTTIEKISPIYYHLKSDSTNQIYNVETNEYSSVSFDKISPFHKGRAKASVNGETFYLNDKLEFSKYSANYLPQTTQTSDGKTYQFVYGINSPSYTTVKSDENKLGIVDASKKNLVIPAIYDQVVNISNEEFELIKDGRFGIINFEGTTVLPFDYKVDKNKKWLKRLSCGFVLLQPDNTSSLYVPGKGIVLDSNYKSFEPIANNYPHLIKVTEVSGEEWIYDIKRPKNKSSKYQKIGKVFQHMIAVKHSNKWGLIRMNGEIAVPFEYDSFEFGKRYIIGKKANSLTLINDIGKIQFMDDYDYMKEVASNHILVMKNRLFGVINVKGETVIPLEYQRIENPERGGYVKVYKDNKWGLIGPNKNFVYECLYDDIKRHNDKLYIIKQKDKYGIMNINGQPAVEFIYDAIKQDHYQRDHIKVSRGNKWGLLNKNLEQVIPCLYDELSYHYGKYTPTIDGKEGLLSKEGKLLLPVEYDRVYLNSKYAWVKKDDYGLFTTTGKQVTPFTYDEYQTLGKDKAIVTVDNKKGVIKLEFDTENLTKTDTHLPIIFDEIIKLTEPKNLFLAKYNDRYLVFNESGLCIKNCLPASEMTSLQLRLDNQSNTENLNTYEGLWKVFLSGINLLDGNDHLKFNYAGDTVTSDHMNLYHSGLAPLAAWDIQTDDNGIRFKSQINKRDIELNFKKIYNDQLQGTMRFDIEVRAIREKKYLSGKKNNSPIGKHGIIEGKYTIDTNNGRRPNQIIELVRKDGKLQLNTTEDSLLRNPVLIELEDMIKIMSSTEEEGYIIKLVIELKKVDDDNLSGKLSTTFQSNAVRIGG